MRRVSALVALSLSVVAGMADVIHVDSNAPAGGDGTKWSTAYDDLQTALASAASGDQVWVARGSYEPKQPGDETSTFSIPSGISVFGGFQGDEGDLSERPADPLDDPSILDGRGGVLHVVTADAVTATINGFVITGGNANGIGTMPRSGGGVLSTDSTLTLAHLLIIDCVATIRGGGVAAYGTGSLTIDSCAFENCDADSATTSGVAGGGVFAEHELAVMSSSIEDCGADIGGAIFYNSSDLCVITNSRFESNTAETSGGAILFDSVPFDFTLIDGCDFIGNQAINANVGSGGAIAYRGNAGGNNLVFSCRFLGNSSGRYGGALYAELGSANDRVSIHNSFFSGNDSQTGGAACNRDSGTMTIVNATMTGNTAGFGGAVHQETGRLEVLNSVIAANTSANGSPVHNNLFVGGAGPNTVSYSLVGFWSGSVPGTNTSGDDPMFLDPDGPDNVQGTDDDDPAVMPGSPAIDAANDSLLDFNITADVLGNARFHDDTGTPDTGVNGGINPPLDIGAFEFQGTTINPCPADIDGNGILNLDDIDLFVAGFLGADLATADCDGSGVLNLDDIDCFVASFLAGCP